MNSDKENQQTKDGLELIRMLTRMTDQERSALLRFAKELLERREKN